MKINAQANKNCENYKKRLHQQARNCYKSLLKEEKDKKKRRKNGTNRNKNMSEEHKQKYGKKQKQNTRKMSL